MEDNQSKPAYWNQEGEFRKKEKARSFVSKRQIALCLASGQNIFAGFLKSEEAGGRA